MFCCSLSTNSRLLRRGRLFVFRFFPALLWLMPLPSHAHPSPNSLIFLDVSPGRVAMEVQLPVPELELAFGHEISKDPATLAERMGSQIRDYLNAHIHAYVSGGRPWQIEIIRLEMAKGKYLDSNIPYWEVVAHLVLTPHPGETTRKFMLGYDVIMHQVINHVAFVSVRSDWETGLHPHTAEASVIARNIKDNTIYPLEVNLEKGNWWKGFQSMLALGIQHIGEGTDHLLFLIVLLLPVMLVANGSRWGTFGGLRYSLVRLLKIVTAFTAGHSVTLLIGALGWLKLPQQPVEVLIAFSIFVSAVHAVYPIFPGKEMYVAAGFGLIHGLAFATVLSNLHLDTGTLAWSILGFNLGIELMQLFVVLIIVPWLLLLSRTPFYSYVRTGGAVLAAAVACAWIAERTSGNTNFIAAFMVKAPQYGPWFVTALAITSVATYTWYYFRWHRLADRNRPVKKL